MNALPATIATPETMTCCTSGAMLDDTVAHDLARVFKALGDPTRVKLMSMIVGSSAGEMCVCDLTAPVGLSQPTVSHHMKLLVEAGLVAREQRGRWAYNRPTTGVLAEAARAIVA
jgi:ArsR family transcriptional regulator, arsenate/arsenite/antimonite-responsive transcriptional repressor